MSGAPDTLRAVVVDDEGLAREELCFLLGQVQGIEVVGQAGDGPAALEMVAEQAPDLVMLDVQMPGLTGFEVARRLLSSGAQSQLVFVTAYDRHDVKREAGEGLDVDLRSVVSSSGGGSSSRRHG